jgi:cytochrome c oxidase subunit I+III
MIIFAFTPLIVGTAMLELDRKELTRFFDARFGGDPLLWQHVFWVFGHPDVYIMFVPLVGVLSHVIQTFARRPVMSYTLMVLAIVATGFLSFGLWVHHMYATGLSPMAMGFFAAASMAVAIPSGVNVFGWIATLWAGTPVWRTPLLFALGGIAIFVVGGVTGVMVAAVPFDLQAHDTYFVVAHLHYVLFGGSIFPIFAGLYYWVPKFSGRLLGERLGRWNFWLMFVGFNVAFLPMHWSGLHGMPRRVYSYPFGLDLSWYNLVSTVGAGVLAVGVLLFLVNVALSLRGGREAGDDPWRGDTLEWSEASPPEDAQFARLPVVRGRHPLWEQATLGPVEGDDPEVARAARLTDHAPSRWRGSIVVDVLDGRPIALAHLPRRSWWPFVMSVGFTLAFMAALLDSGWLALAGGAVTLAALVGWFWPLDTETRAIEESYVDEAAAAGGDATDARPAAVTERGLPLVVGDRASNGYWGTCVLVVILGVALFTLVSSYFYLGDGPRTLPPGRHPPPLAPALWATGAALVAAAVTRWLTAACDRRRHGARLGATLLLLALWGTFAWLAVEAYRAGGFKPAEDAYDSSVLGLLGFAALLGVGTAGMFVAGALWAWRAPRDPRGRGVALNASLVSYAAAASWLVVLAVVHLWPRVA